VGVSRNDRKEFILTNVTGKGKCDVIYPASKTDRNIMVSYLDRMHIGYEFITAEDAAKLLVAADNVGIGCYVDDPSGKEREWRSVDAQLRYIETCPIFGMIQVEHPRMLHVPVSKLHARKFAHTVVEAGCSIEAVS
jgi:hypothetical protein